MIDILSLVNFNNQKRAQYLPQSWGSFYRYNSLGRHLVFDSSNTLDAQKPHYQNFKVDARHVPGMSYGERLQLGLSEIRSDYFLFYPDDFKWIFDYPLIEAVTQARRHSVKSIKLVPRGKNWYSTPQPDPLKWFSGNRVESGEVLTEMDDLRVSARHWRRDFHEQFSLSCNIMNTEFARWVARRIPTTVLSPGQAEKWAYLRLLFYGRYKVAYYKMWTPAFHFVDLAIEGETPGNRLRAATNLLPENEATFNRLCNGR